MHCIYASAATRDFSAAELTELLETARSNNERLGVTGLLLYVEGNFFQVLEGKSSAVKQIYEKILMDKRHTRITRIISETISRPAFTEWSMGFLDLSQDELTEIVGAKDFFAPGIALEGVQSGRARKLLEAFCEGRWRTRFAGPKFVMTAA